LKFHTAEVAGSTQHAHGLGRDLRTDTVAGENSNVE
jgi:hypothetical protein